MFWFVICGCKVLNYVESEYVVMNVGCIVDVVFNVILIKGKNFEKLYILFFY